LQGIDPPERYPMLQFFTSSRRGQMSWNSTDGAEPPAV
jgi:hypothetical protein